MDIKALGPFAVIILVAIIIMSVGATIMQNISDDYYAGSTIVNETATIANGTGRIVLEQADNYIRGLVINSVYNNSKTLCPANEYRIGPVGELSLVLNSTGGGDICTCSADCNVTYAFTGRTITSNISDKGQTSMTEFAGFVPLIALILAAAVVIAIVINQFNP